MSETDISDQIAAIKRRALEVSRIVNGIEGNQTIKEKLAPSVMAQIAIRNVPPPPVLPAVSQSLISVQYQIDAIMASCHIIEPQLETILDERQALESVVTENAGIKLKLFSDQRR